MRTLIPALILLAACGADDTYILHGTVYERPSPTRAVVAHDDIAGLMPAMVMPFDARDAAVLDGVSPGDVIYGRIAIDQSGLWLQKVRVTGHGVIPSDYTHTGTPAVLPGAVFPATEVHLSDGTTWTVGAGQGVPTVLTFAYTRCPLPNFCPATMARMQALQAAIGTDARIAVISIDPEHDTDDVLRDFAAGLEATPGQWMFGRATDLAGVTRAAGLSFNPENGEVLHGLRTLVLAADGTLIERYDDNRYPLDRVVSQLKTGTPAAPAGSEGTLTEPE